MTATPRPVPSSMGDMLDPQRTALLIIDVQNDFVAPDGALGRAGMDLSAVPAAMTHVRTLIAAARGAGVPLVFARVITTPQTDTKAQKALALRSGYGLDAIAICRKDSEGAQYYQITPETGDIEIEKRLYSCFFDTDLENILKRKNIDTLVLAGFSTNCCVESTARDGFHRDFNIFIAGDACGDYDPAAHTASLQAMDSQCAIPMTTDDVVRAWT